MSFHKCEERFYEDAVLSNSCEFAHFSCKKDQRFEEMSQKINQLFLLADYERKGFIVKRDMQRIRPEVPLTPEQLESVFDSLDTKGNGYITVEQFIDGFGDYIDNTCTNGNGKSCESRYYPKIDSNIFISPYNCKKQTLDKLINEIESTGILNSTNVLRQLAKRVKKDSTPQVLEKLEMFLQHLAQDISRQHYEQDLIQDAIRKKEQAHESQVSKLFEEMEVQLSEERNKINNQYELEKRLDTRRRNLEEELYLKDVQLQEAFAKQREMEIKLNSVKARDIATKNENKQLLSMKDEFELNLGRKQQEIKRLKNELQDLKRSKTPDNQNDDLVRAYNAAQKSLIEQEGLLRQLSILRAITASLSQNDSDKMSTQNCEHRNLDHNCCFCYPYFNKTESEEGFEWDEDFHQVNAKNENICQISTPDELFFKCHTPDSPNEGKRINGDISLYEELSLLSEDNQLNSTN